MWNEMKEVVYQGKVETQEALIQRIRNTLAQIANSPHIIIDSIIAIHRHEDKCT